MGWNSRTVGLIEDRGLGVGGQVRILVVSALFTDSPLCVSVHVGVVDTAGYALALLLRLHPLGVRLIQVVSIVPLGWERCRGRGVGRQQVKRVRHW